MTTTDSGVYPPPPSRTSSGRLLRRVRTGRVGAGVAGGLGRYFGLDPVLFRVLFATAAFFGGAGIIAYLLAWAAIPDENTERAPIDGWASALRRRRVPLWVAALGAAFVLWLAAFSWWAPGPFFPVLAVVVILVVAFGRRDLQGGSASTAPASSDPSAPVSLTKDAGDTEPSWVGDTRSWMHEARVAQRERRRRAMPLRLGVVIILVLTLAMLGTVDAVTGIALPVYFWTTLGIVGVGLLAGLALRRTPWSVAVLLVPTVAGLVAFAGTHASLHDGTGQREWRPTTSLDSHYKLAFGQGVLDLRKLASQSTSRQVDVTVGAGQVRVIAPKTLNLTVDANVHIGELEVDGRLFDGGGDHAGGYNYNRVVDPPAGATGSPITVTVRLADGRIDVERR